jgi:DNA-binding Lrp family transcriptional regulator
MLDEYGRRLLNEVQYNFPISSTPFIDLATLLGISVKEFIIALRLFKELGIIKRIGFYYNYKAQGKKAALVALHVKEGLNEVIDFINRDPEVSHNYLRDHKDYNIWFTVKRRSEEEIVKFIEEISKKFKVKRWAVLLSKRLYKLSVKYDLFLGVSRSGPYSEVPEKTFRPEDLGIFPELPKDLRSLPIKERPYSDIARKYGLSEDEVVDYVYEMLRTGILLDPGASLDGELLGFKENAMLILAPRSSSHDLCRCLAKIPNTTHVVLRELYSPEGSREEVCYGVVHAVSRGLAEQVISEIEERCRPKGLEVAYSIKNLKPTMR